MTRNYADTLVFNWLRERVFKIEKPYALPWGGWEKWNKELKESRPVAYFLTETLPDWLEMPGELILDPVNDLRYYVRMRWGYESHKIKTGLKPGTWYEFESRILHGMFNELVDYVEVEKANQQIMWGDADNMKKYNVPWWRHYWLFHWGVWRCPQAGVDHLKWEIDLDNPAQDDQDMNRSQAETAREVAVLYAWWKEVRLPRKEQDAYDVVGYNEFNTRMEEKYGESWIWSSMGNRSKMTAAENAEQRRLSDAVTELEEAWHKEDEEMLIRLVKIRRSMWT